MLQITGLVFNGSIWLKISGVTHILPTYVFMAQTGATTHNRIILVIVTRYVADYWVGVWYVGLFILLLLILFGAVPRKIHTLGM
jgi:hypothetical protein